MDLKAGKLPFVMWREKYLAGEKGVMGYTPELGRFIKKVEETRPGRLERKARGEEFPALTLGERGERLRRYHPDYQEESRREIRVGPNRGYAVYHEIVDLLERSRQRWPLEGGG
jgi:succinate dehydrogenase / fumarate reductase flavoprotein subunit/L-aspartate oxidase